MAEIKTDSEESSGSPSEQNKWTDKNKLTGKFHNFAMKKEATGREWISDKSEKLSKGLDYFSIFGKLGAKRRAEMKKRLEDSGIDLNNIDIDQAFRLLTRTEAVGAWLRRISITLPKLVGKSTAAVSRVGMGVLTSPKYIYQGLATIPGNLKETLFTHATDESQGYLSRWKNIFKSAARTVYQPITNPAKSFALNRGQDLKDVFKAGKSLLATITFRPFQRIFQGLQTPPKAIKDKKKKGRSAEADELSDVQAEADLEAKKLREMIANSQGVETMPATADANDQIQQQVAADLNQGNPQPTPAPPNPANPSNPAAPPTPPPATP